MPSRSTTYWYDTVANNGASYGTQIFGSGNILCRVEVKTAITFPIATTTDTGTQFTADTMVGIQFLINGSSLLTLPADITDQRWLTVDGVDPGSFTATWSPSSDTAAVGVGGGITTVWAGQLPMIDDMELAFTTGTLGASSDGWFLYGAMTAWIA